MQEHSPEAGTLALAALLTGLVTKMQAKGLITNDDAKDVFESAIKSMEKHPQGAGAAAAIKSMIREG